MKINVVKGEFSFFSPAFSTSNQDAYHYLLASKGWKILHQQFLSAWSRTGVHV